MNWWAATVARLQEGARPVSLGRRRRTRLPGPRPRRDRIAEGAGPHAPARAGRHVFSTPVPRVKPGPPGAAARAGSQTRRRLVLTRRQTFGPKHEQLTKNPTNALTPLIAGNSKHGRTNAGTVPINFAPPTPLDSPPALEVRQSSGALAALGNRGRRKTPEFMGIQGKSSLGNGPAAVPGENRF